MPLLSAVMDINRAQPRRMIELLKRHLPDLAGVRVAVLGLAFKPDTDDVRESPALSLIRLLLNEGAIVQAHDPVANENAQQALGESDVLFCGSRDEALAGVDAVLLVTAWGEFLDLPKKLRTMANPPLLVDGRRLIEPADVEQYEGIGLGQATAMYSVLSTQYSNLLAGRE